MRGIYLAVAFFPGVSLAGPAAPAAETVNYVRDIKPLLSTRCYACHGALRQKSNLRLDTAALIRKGGRHGPAIVPGQGVQSLLIAAVTGNNRPRMPPASEGAPLTEKQVGLLKAWIDQGACAPDEPTPEDPCKHWAFQRPVRSAVPRVANPSWGRNPIDAFIAAEHAKRGLQPSPPAARETLLRRVYLELIGLPPTSDELHAFLLDSADDAYEKVIDQLLSSPQYGERWARHWMDVWRYSDWYGRRAVPDVWNSAPQIWRWRDWIIKSLNSDKGYDRMVMEMLAADEIAPEDNDSLVATGYLVRNWYALNYNQWMRDTVEHTGKALLGLTFNCCHCHDHKYDPITQEEYFKFRAFFEPLELRQDRLPGEPDPGPFQKYEYSVLRKVIKGGAIRVFDEKLDAKTFMYRGGDERNRVEGKPAVDPGVPAFLGGDNLAISSIALPADSYYPGLQPLFQRDEIARCEKAVVEARVAGGSRLATAEAELASIKARVAADNARYKRGPGNPDDLARQASKAERFASLCAAQEKLAQDSATAVRKIGGARKGKNKGQEDAAVKQAEQQVVAAATALQAALKNLAADNTRYTPLSPIYPAKSTGRRRALAQWIASRNNPLTARVAVNHLWGRHFGQPLVASVYDFGRNGKLPTHPQLLDWLAVEFMDSGWSMKHLHRLIVTSETYRTQPGPISQEDSNLARDVDNRWLWHFPSRRAEAEVVRDSVLAVARELDVHVGGPVLDSVQDAASRRRSIYFSTYPEEGGHLQMLTFFDAPDPCDCYRRSESIVPQQALLMTNSQLLLDQSRLLARKLSRRLPAAQNGDAGSESAFITSAFEQVLSRRPSRKEQAACFEFLLKQKELFHRIKLQPTKGDGSIAAALEPGMRARESLIRALFNHDDFVTIR